MGRSLKILGSLTFGFGTFEDIDAFGAGGGKTGIFNPLIVGKAETF